MSSKANGKLAWAVRPATRADAGGGHVSRCAAVGAALRPYGPVVAILEKGGESWSQRFKDAGLDVVQESDLGSRIFSGVVLDDYGLGPADVPRWRKQTVGPIVQIEDHGTPLSEIDLAINATPGLSGSKLGDVPALLGSAFAMLAAPYADCRRPQIKTKIDRVVVGIGWVDIHGITERVLAALDRLPQLKVRVDVVLSAKSPNITRVAAMVNAQQNWRLHRDAAELWLLLDGADVAVSGAGQSLLERLAFGIPTLAIAAAGNQKPALLGVVASGAACSLGDLNELSEDRIASAFIMLAEDEDRRLKMSLAAQRLVDGQGASRVAHHLVGM